jgi:hypothetical protein
MHHRASENRAKWLAAMAPLQIPRLLNCALVGIAARLMVAAKFCMHGTVPKAPLLEILPVAIG